jgi:membrane associated rhomboid family serine protease
VLLRLINDFRRAMDLSLVLDQEGIAHQLRSVGDEQWTLSLENDADAIRAESALAAFERENLTPPAPLPRRPAAPLEGVLFGASFALALLLFQLWTGPESDNDWFARGSADAARILHGEWWRAITALTLHADEAHAAGNAALGGLVLALLARRLGAGVACCATLAAGALGTVAAAELMRRHFVSVGSSTAVFGALAELAVLQAFDPGSRRRAWIPLGAGVALLGFLGSSRRADLAGHLCGFASGVLVGAAASRLPRIAGLATQLLLGAGSVLAVVAAWLLAFGHLTK